MTYIYKVTNKLNGKVYIGLTTRTLEVRRKEHERKAAIEKTYFHNSLISDGFDNFTWEVIEECPDNNQQLLQEREKYWISYYESYENRDKGYNRTPGGEGYKLSDEIREKISKANTGKHRTEEMKRHLSEIKTGKKIQWTEEGRKHFMETHKGIKRTPESIEKFKTHPRIEEWNKKISESLKGKVASEETRQKISEAMKSHFDLYTDKKEHFTTWDEIFEALMTEGSLKTKNIDVVRNCIRPSVDNFSKKRYNRYWSRTEFTDTLIDELSKKEKTISEEARKKIGLANSNKNESIFMLNDDRQVIAEFSCRKDAYNYCLENNIATCSLPYTRFSSKIGEANKLSHKFKGFYWIIQKDVETIEN